MQWSLDMAKMQNALEQSEIAKEAAIWGAAINSGGKVLSELIEMGGWFIPEVAKGRMTKKVIGDKKPNETEILTPKKGGGYTKQRTYD